MWHRLLSPLCVATVILGPASGHDNGTRPGGWALAASKGRTVGSPAPTALIPQRHRAGVPPAQRGGGGILTSSSGFQAGAPGSGEIKGGPIAAFIMEVNMRLHRKTCQAGQGTINLLDECCFWNDAVWSVSHHACRYLAHNLQLLYYGLVLPLCKVASILVTLIRGIQLLARYMRSYQSQRESKQQSKEWWPGSPPSIVWGAAEYLDCAICLQVYKPREMLKLLPCCHAYHGKCIDQWHRAQQGDKTCPLCRHGVTAVALIPLGAGNREQW